MCRGSLLLSADSRSRSTWQRIQNRSLSVTAWCSIVDFAHFIHGSIGRAAQWVDGQGNPLGQANSRYQLRVELNMNKPVIMFMSPMDVFTPKVCSLISRLHSIRRNDRHRRCQAIYWEALKRLSTRNRTVGGHNHPIWGSVQATVIGLRNGTFVSLSHE